MSNYELIALDMDGTLLNSQKELSIPTIDALKLAISKNKHVVLATGRSIAELHDFLDMFKILELGIIESGALIYDFKNGKIVHQEAFGLDTLYQLIDLVNQDECIIHLMSEGKSFMTKAGYDMQDQCYKESYRKKHGCRVNFIDDIKEFVTNNKIVKINLYNRSPKIREKTYNSLKHLPLSLVYADTGTIETSPLNVNKATGLAKLCELLNIELKQTIMVGDADNDIDILKVAGLAIAMGNAKDSIKKLCDVIVSDNDHDGCKEAIEKYLI